MNRILFSLLIALMTAGLVSGQVLSLDQTGVTGDALKHGAGYVTGTILNTIKTIPPGSHFLITLRGNENLNWASIGSVSIGDGIGDDFEKVNEISYPPSSRGGTWQTRVSAAQLLNVPGAGAASKLFFNAWGNHVIQKVEFVVPARYTPPAQFSLFSTQSGLGSGVSLTGGNVTPEGIVVSVDKSWGNGFFGFEFEFSSPIDITKFERIVVEWDGVHPHISGLNMIVHYYDNHRTGRYTSTNPPFQMKNYSGGVLGENIATWEDDKMTAWRTLNKRAITKVRFWLDLYWANDVWDNGINLSDPETIDLTIKNVRFVAAEKF